MSKTISKDTPLAEIVLRRYEKPYSDKKRDLIRKLCLSIGLLQPGDSRDIIVDILYALLIAKDEQKLLSAEEVKKQAIQLRQKENLPLKGIADSNVRRQLKRLRDLFLVEKIQNNYRITEFEDLSKIFEEKIEKFYLQNILTRVKEYFDSVK